MSPRLYIFADMAKKIEDEHGKAVLVTPEVLAGLFTLFEHHTECVLLNACCSQMQAEAIHRHIPYVIGMKTFKMDATSQVEPISPYN